MDADSAPGICDASFPPLCHPQSATQSTNTSSVGSACMTTEFNPALSSRVTAIAPAHEMPCDDLVESAELSIQADGSLADAAPSWPSHRVSS